MTPGPVLPAREQLGDLLVELGQARAALAEYEASLRREPNRFNGIYGVARAAELAGDTAKARDSYGQLLTLAVSADTERAELARAKAVLGKPSN